MNEDEFINIWADVSDLKQQITAISDNQIGMLQYNTVTYDLEERLSNLEKKINEIYSILFNAKRLNLSDLDN